MDKNPTPTRGRPTALALALVLGGLLGTGIPPALAAPDSAAQSAATWSRSREQVVAKLLEHARLCKAKKCIRESRAAYEAIVELDPEHGEARKALAHEKKGGRWYIPAASKLPDSPPKVVDEVEAARRAIVEPFVARALEIVAATDLPAEFRETAAADAVAADPKSAAARKANREADDKGVWRLEETVAAQARRAELATEFRTVFDATAPVKLEPATGDEVELLGSGAQAASSFFGRVAGSAANAEIADVARLQPGLEALYIKAIGSLRPLRTLKIVHFPDTATGVAAIQRDQRFDEAAKKLGERLGSMWVPAKLEYFVYGETVEGRRETAMRCAVGTWLHRAFKIDAKRGWALEGFNHWFSEMTLATHRVNYFRPSEYATDAALAAFSERLRTDEAHWMTIASEMAASDAWPGVRSIMAKDVNQLGPEGLLLSYVLSRYVIEAHPEAIGQVLEAVAATEQTDKWMGRLLGATPEGLDRRLRRWTLEIVATTPAAPPPAAPTPPPPPAPPAPPK